MTKSARLFLLPLSFSLIACTHSLEYSGSVVDESGQPLRSALVTLEKDGEVVATGESAKDGRFSVSTTEPGGFGCGILDEGYKLTVRRDASPGAAYAELRGRHFADLGAVKLLDDVMSVELQEGTVFVASNSPSVLVDDGLTWDVAGCGAFPVEALTKSGTHTLRRSERAGDLRLAGKAIELTVPSLPSRVALGGATPAALFDGSFAAAQSYDQTRQTVELAAPGTVRLFFLAGLAAEYADLSTAIPAVTVIQHGAPTKLPATSCQLHDTTVQCWGELADVERIDVSLVDANGQELGFHAGEALVY